MEGNKTTGYVPGCMLSDIRCGTYPLEDNRNRDESGL